jgi:CheY-like chemotaxis protein
MAETSGKDHADEEARAARITSARSDFVSSLSRRIQELRTCLSALEQDPGSPRQRDDLRRRVHALSAGARLLRFGSMATALAGVERTLERAAAVGEIERAELRAVAETLDGLHALAWNEPTNEERPTERPPMPSPIGETAKVPPTVLVVGASGIADAITLPIEHAAENDIECERTEAAANALDLARALAPDVAVIDADLAGAKELIQKLARDPLTEPMPVVVVGTWSTPEEAGGWIAAGAARALSKPISPHELRSACVELSSGRDEHIDYRPLGETTVDDLTNRIIGEIKRGLPDALVSGKSTPIALGDGSDILAAVWGAVARVRDLVTIKSGGGVRFSNRGPEGAMPFAPWWGEGNAPERRGPRAGVGSDPPRRSDIETRLDQRRVVVADDDPAVTWFIGGVLRAAGAEVREAHDGDRALELCFRLSPDLVISDVLMPGLDGFALCRALKRDIALRDVPVILLSWKEDLLQRLRDLGADADGYMRKEASAAALLQRVQEVLRPRARIEARIAESGEVRGRLDGVTPRSLLHITSRVRPDARLRVRDASFLYELEIRGGAPKSATRTTSDGAFQRGKEVFAAVLGVRAGRFVVTHAERAVRGTLDGDLEQQLEAPLAHARAALKLFGGTRLLEVHRVTVAIDRVVAYLSATPEPARSLVNRIAHGASPRALILGSEVAPGQLEAVLCDLATHGAVIGVQGSGGADLLGPALEHELFSIRRGGAPSAPPEIAAPVDISVPADVGSAPEIIAPVEMGSPPPALPIEPFARVDEQPAAATPPVPEPRAPLESDVGVRVSLESDSGARITLDSDPAASLPSGELGHGVHSPERAASVGSSETASAAFVATGGAETQDRPAVGNEAIAVRWESSANIDVEQSDRHVAPMELDEHTPSSLEAAVIREISDRTPLPAPAPQPPPDKSEGSIVDTSELRARPHQTAPAALPSLPPDAVVPATPSEERLPSAAPAVVSSPPPPSPPRQAPESVPPTVHPLTAVKEPAPRRDEAAHRARADAAVLEASREASARAWGSAAALASASSRVSPAAPTPARPISEPPEIPKGEGKGGGSFGIGLVVALGAMAVLFLGLRYGQSRLGEAAPPPVDPQLAEEPAFPELPASAMVGLPPPAVSAGAVSPAGDGGITTSLADAGRVAPTFGSGSNGLGHPSASAQSTSGEDLPLPPGVVVSPNQGLLDVETAGKESIFVDAVELGRGPTLRLVLAPGVHEVRQRVRGEWRIRFVLIRPSRRTRLPLSSWTR